MRIFGRRDRPHPGAKLSLFEHAGGYHYQLWVTNLPAAIRGWRGKNVGIGRFPPATSPSTRPGCNRHQVRYVVIGAFAAIAQQAPIPATRDIDITPDTVAET